jgi:chemotaxis protein methyltransferase CheR
MAVEIDDNLYAKLCAIVYQRSGLYFDIRKKYFVERRIKHRMAVVGATDVYQYYRQLCDNSGELQELIESLTTNETYFFRDYHQLRAFAEEILPEVLQEKRDRTDYSLRIWSAGCSTGEEPYTLAIILREIIPDIERWNISLVGTDINRTALTVARRAVYEERSIRNVPKVYLERYFRDAGGAHKLVPLITKMVRFREASLTDVSVARELCNQDFIFCRNVLIYFDDMARKRVVQLLYDALRPGGYIFLGHAESVSRVTNAFRQERRGNVLVYAK